MIQRFLLYKNKKKIKKAMNILYFMSGPAWNRLEIAGSGIGNVAREWHAERLEARGSAVRVFHVPVPFPFFFF
jgi:hypothetical protein